MFKKNWLNLLHSLSLKPSAHFPFYSFEVKSRQHAAFATFFSRPSVWETRIIFFFFFWVSFSVFFLLKKRKPLKIISSCKHGLSLMETKNKAMSPNIFLAFVCHLLSPSWDWRKPPQMALINRSPTTRHTFFSKRFKRLNAKTFLMVILLLSK